MTDSIYGAAVEGSPASGMSAGDLALSGSRGLARARANAPQGDSTDPRDGANRVDARTRESGKEQEGALKMNSSASVPMFPRPHQLTSGLTVPGQPAV